ncbi:unnamed protein product [Rotaria socialis]|uniref:NHL repeat-containing protein n=1 Tax=Rotaria socialis TaxID=392032 RepID=A0A821UJI1_9BILA|nr:unnamed protein product [Rotaria socialis]CAF4890591.1 unnamed protein product [Rotaria socialis]
MFLLCECGYESIECECSFYVHPHFTFTPFLAQQLYVDRDGSAFVADSANSRVMKWSLNASVGEIVAGGTGVGINSNNIGSPTSVFVDRLGSIYVVDTYNERIVRWLKGAQAGTIIAGGPGLGSSAKLLEHPKDLAFDREGNL